MMRLALVVTLAFTACLGVSALDADSRPVSKVRTLLSDMVETLEKEAKEDEDVYEEMSCWCETGKVTKTKALADNKDKVALLADQMEGYVAGSARLATEIEKLNKEIAENTEALDTATAQRKKELAEFGAEESDGLKSIGSMKGAIAALSKHNSEMQEPQSFLQAPASDDALGQAAMVAKSAFDRHSDLLADAVTSEQRETVEGLVLLQQGVESKIKQPQSGAVFGMLKGMKESFENNLAKSQDEETTNQKDYEALKAAKEEELAAGNNAVETKTQELADSDEKNAQASTDSEETSDTIDADTDFLKNLKEQCVNVDAEFAARKKTRQEEIGAVGKALAFLSSDEAKDLMARTFGGSAAAAASFVQLQDSSKKRALVAKLLGKTADPRVAMLATMAKNPAFKEVRAQLNAMIDKLGTEKEEEIKHKDFCIDAIQKNEVDTDSKNNVKNDYQAIIDDHAMTIKQLTKDLAELRAAIDAAHVSLKRASEDRQKANKDFQQTVADQRATAKLLVAVQEILQGFYGKESLLQTGVRRVAEPAGAPPPPGFKKMEKNAQSGGVMGMIEQIISDAKAMEAEALKDEEAGQVSYENLVADTNASITAAQKSMTSKTEEKAKNEGAKVQKQLELDTVDTELSALKDASDDLHKDCDWTLENFDARQGARNDEIQALREALGIF